MKIQFENTASYEGKLTVDGKEMLVTLEHGNIVLKNANGNALRDLVGERLAGALFQCMQAEAVVSEENCDVFSPELGKLPLINIRREVLHRLGIGK